MSYLRKWIEDKRMKSEQDRGKDIIKNIILIGLSSEEASDIIYQQLPNWTIGINYSKNTLRRKYHRIMLYIDDGLVSEVRIE